MDNFTEAVANLAGGGRLKADDEMHLEMVMPVAQPNGVTLDRLAREGWIERMPNGGTFKISDEGLKAYLRYCDGQTSKLRIEGADNG